MAAGLAVVAAAFLGILTILAILADFDHEGDRLEAVQDGYYGRVGSDVHPFFVSYPSATDGHKGLNSASMLRLGLAQCRWARTS